MVPVGCGLEIVPHSLNQNLGTAEERLSGSCSGLLKNHVSQVGKCIPERFLGKGVSANFSGEVVLNPEVGLSTIELGQTFRFL